jgi:signal transduction histidine kinase
MREPHDRAGHRSGADAASAPADRSVPANGPAVWGLGAAGAGSWGPQARSHGPWSGRPPLAVRLFGPLLLMLVQVVGTVGAAHDQPSRRPVDVFAVLLLVAGPAALWMVRRSPRLACASVVAATATYLLAGYPYGPVFAGPAVALVLTVVRGHRTSAWVSAVALVVADAVGRMVRDRDHWSWGSQLGVLGWVLVILAVAEVVRVRAERAASFRAALQERRRRQAGEERLRIAQELHDVVAHHMSLINVQAGVALHLADRKPENVEPALQAIKDASKEALTELRSLIGVLREDSPAPRAPAPTLAAVDDIVARSAHAGLVITKTIAGQPRRLPASVELAAYRIIQEAVTNVVRHADAHRAEVTIGYGAEVLTLRIDDDGHGGPRATDLEPGNGLRGMHERAEVLGGTFAVGPAPAGGLRLEASLPTGGGT